MAFLPAVWFVAAWISATNLLITIVAVAVVYWWYQKQDWDGRKKIDEELGKALDGPARLPFFGNSLDFMRGGVVAMQKVMEYTKKYGSRYRLWLGSELFVVLADPYEIETVLYSNNAMDKPIHFQRLSDIFGCSIFTLPGEPMKLRRRKLVHPFNANCLSQYVPSVQSTTDDLVVALKKAICSSSNSVKQQQPLLLDMWKYIPLVTFDNITKTAMDLRMDPTSKELLSFHELSKKGGALGIERMFSPLSRYSIIDKIIFAKRMKSITDKSHGFIEQATKEKLDYLGSKEGKELMKNDENDYGNEGDKAHGDKKDAIMKYFRTAYKLSVDMKDPNVLLDELRTIIGAGTDTVAITLCSALLMIAAQPDVQEKVYKEVTQLYKEKEGGVLEYSDMKKLVYTEQVIKETLRLFTLVPYIYRMLTADTKIGDTVYPKGTNLIISLWGVHHDERYFPKPYEFNPDRFSTDALQARPKCAFIPFSTGPRGCIGMTFAMIEMKLIIANLVKQFKFDTSLRCFSDVKLATGFITTSVIGYPMSIECRE